MYSVYSVNREREGFTEFKGNNLPVAQLLPIHLLFSPFDVSPSHHDFSHRQKRKTCCNPLLDRVYFPPTHFCFPIHANRGRFLFDLFHQLYHPNLFLFILPTNFPKVSFLSKSSALLIHPVPVNCNSYFTNLFILIYIPPEYFI